MRPSRFSFQRLDADSLAGTRRKGLRHINLVSVMIGNGLCVPLLSPLSASR